MENIELIARPRLAKRVGRVFGVGGLVILDAAQELLRLAYLLAGLAVREMARAATLVRNADPARQVEAVLRPRPRRKQLVRPEVRSNTSRRVCTGA